jgi:uncharacterized protein (TIGR02145 family)
MKFNLIKTLSVFCLFCINVSNAQVGIGVPAENIHPSAELEVKSTTKGFLPPRMTKAERDLISSPAAGLFVFQTDGDANEPTGLYFFDGTAWRNGAGVQGIKGDKGETGAQGLPGATGLTGTQGLPGAQGQNTLVKTTTEAAGLNCITGGVKIEYGFDANNSGTLDVAEINPTLTKYVCNRLQGPIGAKGAQGTPGATGPAGVSGLPSGGTNGQIITNCYGLPTWTTRGQCPGKPGPNITDVENNTYKTVTIGTQQWMAENLKVSKYSDGTDIPKEPDNAKWSQLSTGAWAYYGNDATKNAKYGKLYNWYALSKTKNGNKNVCPTGWHVPTDTEWTVLTDYLGGANVAGGKMKEMGTTSWNSPNTDATNLSLFSALPGGYRSWNGGYTDVSGSGNWWSSTGDISDSDWGRGLGSWDGSARRITFYKPSGLSVRCLRD